MARVAIKEFGAVNKNLDGAIVTIYQTDSTGAKTTTKATLYQDATGSGTRSNPQTLDGDGKLQAACYVDTTVIAEISNITVATDRSVRRLNQEPTQFLLPITSAGSVSVNLENPDINGGTIDAAVIGASTAAAGTFTALTCSSFTETSDERLKTNIKPLYGAASVLLALNPVSYERRTTASTQRVEMGFIAQEVEKVLPQIVSHDGEYLAVHYLDIIALLVRGYKEMADHIIDLNHRIRSLEVE